MDVVALFLKLLTQLHMPTNIAIYIYLKSIMETRSYAALRAADLDWIIGTEYSPGTYLIFVTSATSILV